jgi:uncharacterized membrane protein
VDQFAHLYARNPLIAIHLMCALAALAIGAWQLVRSANGDGGHRLIGWSWVLCMGAAVISSAFIRDYRMPNIAGFTPIHLFTLYVAWHLPRGVYFAKTGQIAAHRATMRGLYFGGCVVAGLFTLLPGRFLGNLVWKQAFGLL